MPPETPGRATPRDTGDTEGSTGSTPTFKAGAEQVDEGTGPPASKEAPGAGDLPYASDERPARRRDRPSDADRGRYAKPGGGKGKVRARKVRRVVRHIEPWSVLKISVLFFLAIFLIICVASAVLWNAARASGAIDDVESFITSVGGFGNCEPIDGQDPSTTGTTQPGAPTTVPVDQVDPAGEATSVPEPVAPVDPVDDEDCPEGQELVGDFKFEDGRIFQAFALGGIVLVLAGAAGAVVLTLLFNLISDLTGGMRLTVLEEDPSPRQRAGSPRPRARD
jgi:hypothetical protein